MTNREISTHSFDKSPQPVSLRGVAQVASMVVGSGLIATSAGIVLHDIDRYSNKAENAFPHITDVSTSTFYDEGIISYDAGNESMADSVYINVEKLKALEDPQEEQAVILEAKREQERLTQRENREDSLRNDESHMTIGPLELPFARHNLGYVIAGAAAVTIATGFGSIVQDSRKELRSRERTTSPSGKSK